MTAWAKLSIFVVAFLIVDVQSYRKNWRHKHGHDCGWGKCEFPCRKVWGEDGRYKCECKPLCSPPKCDPGCEVQKVFNGPCPECECKGPDGIDIDEIPLKVNCAPVKCGAPCMEIPPDSPEECPRCDCDVPDDSKPAEIACDPPKCPRGCSIQKVFDGPCPGCDCKNEEGRRKPFGIICDPPKCSDGCKIQTVYDGPCPGCDCDEDYKGNDIKPGDIVCDPPKCPPGCSIEEDINGPCPVCKCNDQDEKPKVGCDPPKCPESCTIKINYEGACPVCDCSGEGLLVPRNNRKRGSNKPKVFCSPPKCPPECTIQKVFDGPCPECDCPKDDIEDEKLCPEIREDCYMPGCKLVTMEDGCDICKCEPQCSPPKCQRWCRIKEVEGECPVCECPKRKFEWKRKRD